MVVSRELQGCARGKEAGYAALAKNIFTSFQSQGYYCIDLDSQELGVVLLANEVLARLAAHRSSSGIYQVQGGFGLPSPSAEWIELHQPSTLDDAAISTEVESGNNAASVLDGVGRSLIKAVAYSLGLPTYTFSCMLDDEVLRPGQTSSSRLGCMRDPSALELADLQTGAVAIIRADQPGLEVQSQGGSTWNAVPHKAGQVVVLPGFALTHATAGKISTRSFRIVEQQSRSTSSTSTSASPSERPHILFYKLDVRPDAVVDPVSLLRLKSPLEVLPRYRTAYQGKELSRVWEDTQDELAAAAAAAASSATPKRPLPDPSPHQGPAKRQDTRPQAGTPAAQQPGPSRAPAGPRPAASPATASPAAGGIITLRCRQDGDEDVDFRMYMTTPFRKLMAGYAKVKGLEGEWPVRLRFFRNGERLSTDETPADVGVEDGDVIQVLSEQAGD